MDDFFDKLKEHASTAKDGAMKIGKQVYARTNNVLNQTKLNFSINDSESKVNDLYTKIGKTVYENYLKESCVEEDFYDDCVKIDDLLAEIENMRERIAELKNSVKCRTCGAYNKENSKYCSKCGEKLQDEASAAEDITEAVQETAEVVSDTAEAAGDIVSDAVAEAAEAVEETVNATEEKTAKRVVTIKARRPQESE